MRFGYELDEDGHPIIPVSGANWVAPPLPDNVPAWQEPVAGDPNEWLSYVKPQPSWGLLVLAVVGGFYFWSKS